jgi:hypothetical protein
MTEHQWNQITIWSIAIMLPLVGIAKFWFALIMKRNTHTRTRVGSWLVRLFCAMGGMAFALGVVYLLSLFAGYQWMPIDLWMRWVMRIVVVMAATWALVCNYMLVRAILPVLRDINEYVYGESEKA